MARNTITIINQNNKITLTDKVTGNAVSVNSTTRKKVEAKTGTTNVTVENQLISTVEVLRQQGPRGVRGEKGEPGQLNYFEDLTITGSLYVSGGVGNGRVTASLVSSSEGFIGDLTGTSSFANDAESSSFALTASYIETASFANDAESASFATTSSFSYTSSFSNTASKVTIEEKELDAGGLVFALRANSGEVTEAGFKSATGRNVTIFTATNPITPTADVTEFRIGNSGNPGGINILNASGDPAYVKTNVSDLYLLANKGLYLSGSSITALNPFTASIISASGGISGSLEGTASFADTASFALNVPEDSGFPFTGSAAITGSLNVIGPITSSQISSSGIISGSTFYGDGANLTGIGSNPFPFTGSALVSGSFIITGSMEVSEAITASAINTVGTGVPTIESATDIILDATNAVVIESSPLRLNSYTNSQTSSITTTGDIYFNSDTSKFMGYNGSDHVELG